MSRVHVEYQYKDWRTKPPSLLVEGPAQMRWYCKQADAVVLHDQEGGGYRCSVCQRWVPGAEVVVLLSTTEDWWKQHSLQVPDFLRADYKEPENDD